MLQPERIKRDRSRRADSRARADVIVVMAYGQILPRACSNSDGRLPELARLAAAATSRRGTDPGRHHRRRRGDRHHGDVHGRRPRYRRHPAAGHEFRLPPDETGGSLHDRAGGESRRRAGGGAAINSQRERRRAFRRMRAARPTRRSWSANMAGSIGPQPAEVIERKIRAFNPWPGASTSCAMTAGSGAKAEDLPCASVADEPAVPPEQ